MSKYREYNEVDFDHDFCKADGARAGVSPHQCGGVPWKDGWCYNHEPGVVEARARSKFEREGTKALKDLTDAFEIVAANLEGRGYPQSARMLQVLKPEAA